MILHLIGKIVMYFMPSESEEEESMDSEEDNMEGEEEEDSKTGLMANGLVLCKKPVPVEILCSILKWVDGDTLVFSCRRVCKGWRDVVDEMVWEEKLDCTKTLLGPRSEEQVPWWVAYQVAKNALFTRNLLKNNCGEQKFNHWGILENFGDRWKVEKKPQGTTSDLPKCEEVGICESCFVTTFQWCSKEQIIKLSETGLSDKIMDEIQPDFECSEWISPRFDCGGVYGMAISLLDAEGKELMVPVIKEVRLESASNWTKVSTVLRGPYPRGVRLLRFIHKGKDTQFWKGWYGIKMTGCCVKPVFPKERFISAIASTSDK